jgi:hypothetical protein
LVSNLEFNPNPDQSIGGDDGTGVCVAVVVVVVDSIASDTGEITITSGCYYYQQLLFLVYSIQLNKCLKAILMTLKPFFTNRVKHFPKGSQ